MSGYPHVKLDAEGRLALAETVAAMRSGTCFVLAAVPDVHWRPESVFAAVEIDILATHNVYSDCPEVAQALEYLRGRLAAKKEQQQEGGGR